GPPGAPGGDPIEAAFFCRVVLLHTGAPDCCWEAPAEAEGAAEAAAAAAAAAEGTPLLLQQQDGLDLDWKPQQQKGPSAVFSGRLSSRSKQDTAAGGPPGEKGPHTSLLLQQQKQQALLQQALQEGGPGVTLGELSEAVRAALGLRDPSHAQQQQQQRQQQQQQHQIERTQTLLRWALKVLQQLHQEEGALEDLLLLLQQDSPCLLQGPLQQDSEAAAADTFSVETGAQLSSAAGSSLMGVPLGGPPNGAPLLPAAEAASVGPPVAAAGGPVEPPRGPPIERGPPGAPGAPDLCSTSSSMAASSVSSESDEESSTAEGGPLYPVLGAPGAPGGPPGLRKKRGPK
ncbi:hypothetical protein ETH_00037910, partial [Eimeria tenella]